MWSIWMVMDNIVWITTILRANLSTNQFVHYLDLIPFPTACHVLLLFYIRSTGEDGIYSHCCQATEGCANPAGNPRNCCPTASSAEVQVEFGLIGFQSDLTVMFRFTYLCLCFLNVSLLLGRQPAGALVCF